MSTTFDDVRDLYQEVILQRGRRPLHGHRPERFDVSAKGDNPMCGDRVEVFVRLDGNRIAETGFEARGCAISVASADLMAEAVRGRDATSARALFDDLRRLVTMGACPDCDPALDDLAPLGGVHEYPSRVKCATLPWHALLAALEGERETSSE